MPGGNAASSARVPSVEPSFTSTICQGRAVGASTVAMSGIRRRSAVSSLNAGSRMKTRPTDTLDVEVVTANGFAAVGFRAFHGRFQIPMNHPVQRVHHIFRAMHLALRDRALHSRLHYVTDFRGHAVYPLYIMPRQKLECL
jgi:hypothetical protein